MPEPELLHVVPAAGMKESVERRLAPPGTLTYAQNVRFEKAGRIRKRGGSEQLGAFPGSGVAFGGSWVAGDLACIDNTVHRLHEDSGTWGAIGNDTPVTPLGRYPAQLNEADWVYSPAVAVIGSVAVVASSGITWSASSKVRITGMSIDGERLWETSVAGYKPRLLLVGSTLYCVYLEAVGGGFGKIRYSTVTAAGVASAPADLVTGAYTLFDIALLDGSSSWLVVTYSTAPLAVVRLFTGVTPGATNNVTSDAAVQGLAVAGNTSDLVWVAWHQGADLKAIAFPANLGTPITSGVTLFTGASTGNPTGDPTILRLTSTTALVAVSRTGTIVTSPNLTDVRGVQACILSTAAAGTVSRTGTTWGWSVASKFAPSSTSPALSTSTRARLWVTDGERHGLLDLSITGTEGTLDGAIIGITYERQAWPNAIGHLPAIVLGTFGDEQRDIACTVLQWRARQVLPASDLCAFTVRKTVLAPRESVRSVHRVGPVSYLGGGAALLDLQPRPAGVTFRYHPCNGFPSRPRAVGAAISGGSLTASTTYTYYPVWEHLDEAGQRVRSVGDPFTVTTNGTDKQATLHGTIPGACQRPGVTLHYYRSWGGGAPYRVTPDSGAPAVTDTTGGGTTAGYVAYTDSMSDGVAPTHEELIFAPGGQLPPDPPSGGRLVAQGDGRVFVGGWDPNVVWVSKLWVPGEAVQFVDDDVFRIFFPEALTALAYQDGALVGFGLHGIYIVAGEGPTDNGESPYPGPRQLPADSGCVDWRGVITTAAGTFYQSQSGIMLLPRGFGPPVFVGADVQDTLAAANVAGGGNLVFGAAKSRTSDGNELVHFAAGQSILTFDIRSAAWSVDLITGAQPVAIGTIDDRLVALRASTSTDAAIWFPEDGIRNADYQNGNVWCEMRLRFTELRPFGVCGHGRFEQLVFAIEGDLSTIQAEFNVKTTVDDGFETQTQPETRTFRLGGPTGLQDDGASGMVYLGRVPAQQAGSALEVELYDAKTSDGAVTARSWEFFGFSLEWLAELGIRKLQYAAVQ